MRIGERDAFSIPTMPTEHTFKAGDRIGIIVPGHLIGRTDATEGGRAATNDSIITVVAKRSKITLPIVGAARQRCGRAASRTGMRRPRPRGRRYPSAARRELPVSDARAQRPARAAA
jgi:hypothetical protein